MNLSDFSLTLPLVKSKLLHRQMCDATLKLTLPALYSRLTARMYILPYQILHSFAENNHFEVITASSIVELDFTFIRN